MNGFLIRMRSGMIRGRYFMLGIPCWCMVTLAPVAARADISQIDSVYIRADDDNASPGEGIYLQVGPNTPMLLQRNLISVYVPMTSNTDITTEDLFATDQLESRGILVVDGYSTLSGGASISNGASISGGLNNNSGGITNAGAISGVSTLSASGQISSGSVSTGAISSTSINNNSGGITNAGAISGATTIGMGGAP
jgi:hypothetical protein